MVEKWWCEYKNHDNFNRGYICKLANPTGQRFGLMVSTYNGTREKCMDMMLTTNEKGKVDCY